MADDEQKDLRSQLASITGRIDQHKAHVGEIQERVERAKSGGTQIPLSEFPKIMEEIGRHKDGMRDEAKRANIVYGRLKELGLTTPEDEAHRTKLVEEYEIEDW